MLFRSGIAHGTVTVIINSEPFEVTTFRVDGEYKDGRHPESVSFTATVDGDLARRDFTVNAMAYNHNEGLIDLFGGREDLKRGIIRAVGDPFVRFSEDALRILRALRFSSVLGFKIDENTERAIFELFPTLDLISGERIYQELKKLVSGVGAFRILDKYSEVISSFIPSFSLISLPEREKFESLSAEHRLALILSRIGSENLRQARARLKLDNKSYMLAEAVALGAPPKDSSDRELGLYLLRMKSDSAAVALVAIAEAYGELPEGTLRRTKALIEADFPRTVGHLKIDGRDIVSLGFVGKAISDAQAKALFAVASGEIANERRALLNFLESIKD